LTNFVTIKKSLLRLKKLEKMEVDGTFENLTKKEIAALAKERAKLQKNLGGIKEMKELPGILFVIDTRMEAIAVAEAQRMGIPIVAVVDTNCNPEGIKHPIPGNDDAIRAIKLFVTAFADACLDGADMAKDRRGKDSDRDPEEALRQTAQGEAAAESPADAEPQAAEERRTEDAAEA
ncbi:MAG: 30S ribosomal protein S2, partial [Desulfovibrio sp.]|nr:30S ribosomal protein S2 [Desulfovibrio sp.]